MDIIQMEGEDVILIYVNIESQIDLLIIEDIVVRIVIVNQQQINIMIEQLFQKSV
jgi:hypothetical protein